MSFSGVRPMLLTEAWLASSFTWPITVLWRGLLGPAIAGLGGEPGAAGAPCGSAATGANPPAGAAAALAITCASCTGLSATWNCVRKSNGRVACGAIGAPFAKVGPLPRSLKVMAPFWWAMRACSGATPGPPRRMSQCGALPTSSVDLPNPGIMAEQYFVSLESNRGEAASLNLRAELG